MNSATIERCLVEAIRSQECRDVLNLLRRPDEKRSPESFREHVVGAMREYFERAGLKEEGEAMLAQLVIARKKGTTHAFAVTLRDRFLPSGEDEFGEWEIAAASPNPA